MYDIYEFCKKNQCKIIFGYDNGLLTVSAMFKTGHVVRRHIDEQEMLSYHGDTQEMFNYLLTVIEEDYYREVRRTNYE